MYYRSYTGPRTRGFIRSTWIPFLIVAFPLLLSGCDIFGTALDERAPRLVIQRPVDEATVSGKNILISVTAEALGDNNFISFMNINVNGERAGEALFDGNIFKFRWNSFDHEDGLYRIEAVAFDRFQARGVSGPVLVTVTNTSQGNGPELMIITPQEDDKVNGLVRVVARTRPGQPFVTRVDLLVDGVAVASTSNVSGGNSFVFDWDTVFELAGEHVLEVKAYSGPTTFRISESVTVNIDEDDEGDGSPGTVRWRSSSYQGEVWGSVAVGFNNDIYVGTTAKKLYSFAPNGTEKWSFDVKGAIRSSPLVGNNEDLFVTTEGGYVYGISSTGDQLWQYSTGALLRSSPALGVEGVLYFGDSEGIVHAVNTFGGLPMPGRIAGTWPVKISDMPIVAPPVIARDRTVIVASTDGFLYALAPDGTLLWKTSQRVGSTIGSSGITSDGELVSVMVGMALVERQLSITLPTGEIRTSTATVVYVVSNAGLLFSVSAEDGSILWSYPLTGPLRSGPVVGTDGTIYVGTSTGLIALNEEADAFTPRLRFVYPATDVGTPAIDANGVIHFVSAEHVVAIFPNNTPYWEYDLGHQADGPLTINRAGALLVPGQNGIMTAFETGSVGLAQGQWPMYQRNARHTGRIGIDADDG